MIWLFTFLLPESLAFYRFFGLSLGYIYLVMFVPGTLPFTKGGWGFKFFLNRESSEFSSKKGGVGKLGDSSKNGGGYHQLTLTNPF